MGSPESEPAIDHQVQAWARAELDGDTAALNSILHPDFIGVGPFGFLLGRDQWMRRFVDGLTYTAFAFTADTPVRTINGCAVVIGTQHQRGDLNGRPVDSAFRATLIFAAAPTPRLAGIHLCPRTPPEPPGDRMPSNDYGSGENRD
jgi:Domain of unknown function (DUF4440)